jgi:hypothetical protein
MSEDVRSWKVEGVLVEGKAAKAAMYERLAALAAFASFQARVSQFERWRPDKLCGSPRPAPGPGAALAVLNGFLRCTAPGRAQVVMN